MPHLGAALSILKSVRDARASKGAEEDFRFFFCTWGSDCLLYRHSKCSQLVGVVWYRGLVAKERQRASVTRDAGSTDRFGAAHKADTLESRKDEKGRSSMNSHAAEEGGKKAQGVLRKPLDSPQSEKLNELFENMRRVFLAKLSTPAPYPAASWCRGVSCFIGACRQGGKNRPFFGGIWTILKLVWEGPFRCRHWPYSEKKKKREKKRKKT
jgi:hypothetical protein